MRFSTKKKEKVHTRLGGLETLNEGLQSYARIMIVVGAFSLVLNLLMLTTPLYMMQVYDRVLSSRSEETLLMLTILAVGALLFIGFLEGTRLVLLSRSASRFEVNIGEKIFRASLFGSGARREGVSGLQDLIQLRQFASSPIVCAFFDLMMMPLYLAVLFMLHSHLGWITITAAMIIAAASLVGHACVQKVMREADHKRGEAMAHAQAANRDTETIEAMGMYGNAEQRWSQSTLNALHLSDTVQKRNAIFSSVVRTIRLTLQVAILGYGASLVLSSELSAGVIIAASIISARALAPLDQLSGGWANVVAAGQAFSRLKKLLSTVSTVDQAECVEKIDGAVSAEGLYYSPAPGATPIIKGVSFNISKGEVLGIIGRSGAGKTTLTRLLVGALDSTMGTVRVGGSNLMNIDRETLGKEIGYMSQDVQFFPGSVAENIARLSTDADPEAIIKAAKLAGCHEMIQQLPKGYATKIGPDSTLSEGQKQRIALARAFYDDPRIVILDEPNSHLDGEGEMALAEAVGRAREAGISCIITTQRTGIAQLADSILCLENGSVRAFGPAAKVLAGNNNQQTEPKQSARAA